MWVEAAENIGNERLDCLDAALVADIFSRLDPHPAFKTIEFQLDTYYRKGTTSPLVKDLVAGVTADPLVIFSTSQANIAALSYFLATGWSAGDRALPFVLLDDPIQSMDDVDVLGFADQPVARKYDRAAIFACDVENMTSRYAVTPATKSLTNGLVVPFR